MIILGIDPGFGRVGYGIIDYTKNKYRVIEFGCITTPANTNFPKRLNKIETDLREVLSRYKIDAASIEDLFFNTNSKTAIKVAEARGVILNTLVSEGIDIHEYTPLQAKLAIVGYGRAEKIQVKEMVKRFLNLEQMPKLDDTTDALAIAICHTHNMRFNQYIK
ncbi:MAG: crossover junction endodeoxyribonuclease RuvC [Clostridia bacterium]|nr:crossover junction endodeoxyribonuclease RuvC [Clostridia bacterium]